MRRRCGRSRSASRAGRRCSRSRTGRCRSPGEGEILIAVAAAGVNRPDVMQRKGKYPPPPGASDIPGLEISGLVARVGEGVTRFRKGDEVVALVPGGGYAEYCAAHEATDAAAARAADAGRRRRHARDDLHRLAQRLRARRAAARRVAAGARRHERHRHDRDPARQSVRRLRRRDRRVRREMRGDQAARRRRRHQLQDRPISSRR